MRLIRQVDASTIADYLLCTAYEAGEILTHLKLQKLLYYCQAWHLGVFKTPLFEDDFEAWVHGPVIKSIYNEYKKFGYLHIEKDLPCSEDGNENPLIIQLEKLVGPDSFSLLEEVLSEYMGCTAYELETMTHQEDPWVLARGGIPNFSPCSNIITKKSMLEYYSQYVGSAC